MNSTLPEILRPRKARDAGLAADGQWFNRCRDPAFLCARIGGRVLRVNDAALAVYGYSADEFSSMTLEDLELAQDAAQDEFNPAAVRSFAVEACTGDLRVHRKKCGGLICVDLVSQRHDAEDAENRESSERDDGCIVFARDVSRWFRTHERYLIAEKRAETIISTASGLRRIVGRVANLGAWRINVADQIVWWSEETARIHDAPYASHLSLEDAFGFYDREQRYSLQEAFADLTITKQSVDIELRLMTGSGEQRWVRILGEPELDSDGKVVSVIGACVDVSQDVARRKESQALADRLQDTLDCMSDAFCILDPQLRLTFLNNAFARAFSRRDENVLGSYICEVVPDVAGTPLQEQLAEVALTGQALDTTMHLPSRNAWVDMSAYRTRDGVAVYFSDVTERTVAEEKLRSSDERFQLLAAATQDVVRDWRLPSDFIWWNETGAELLGLAGHLGRKDATWDARIHPEDRSRVLASLESFLESDATTWQAEYRYEPGPGTCMDVIDRGYLIRSEAGSPVRMLNSMLDITERKELAEHLRHAQKMEAIGQLTGGVAHDFNNLLTVILGNAELLAEQLQLPGQEYSRELAQMTVAAAERASNMTNRLLAFARKQSLEPAVIDLNQMLSSLSMLFQRSVSEDIDISIVGDADLWMCAADPSQLEVALLNLVVNARDAMPDGGRVTLETHNVELAGPPHPDGYAVPGGDYVMVSVTDSGVGMSEETRRRVFEPFFTTKAVGKGNGLGLSMVYGFIKQSKGHVTISSRENGGTMVCLYLPRDRTGPTQIPRNDSTDCPSPGGEESILIVEDDALVRKHAGTVLKKLGYRVLSAASGPEALQTLAVNANVQLLFTDITMPGGLNGTELARIAQGLYPDLKVLFTTGYADSVVLNDGRVNGKLDIVSKPYRSEELARQIRHILDRSETL